MRRRSEVTVRPFREGDRLYRIGVHRHESKTPLYEAATELIVSPPQNRAPHRVVRRPPPLPKPRIVITEEEPRSYVVMLFLGAGIILAAALLALL